MLRVIKNLTAHSGKFSAFSPKLSAMPKSPRHHRNCISGKYPGTTQERLTVAPEKVSWDVPWKDYNPPDYTADSLKNKPYADPDVKDSTFRPHFNEYDGDIDRRSHMGDYKIVDGLPQNPMGRTGLEGRGKLGRYGPNHAGDPVVTRWKTDKNGNVTYHSEDDDDTGGKPILQFVAIERQSGNEWAFPGGMVDSGEAVEDTIEREFFEEALEGEGASDHDIEHNRTLMENYFRNGVELYRGYVDDPRNTDNAWMETIALHYHDQSGSHLGKLKLTPGSDAKSVAWKDVGGNLKLYANHSDILRKAAERLEAHW